MNTGDLEKYKKDVVFIYYEWWGGQPHDRLFWTATLNGEIIDYHTKEELIRQAERMHKKWIVLRYHKKQRGKVSIVQKSKEFTL